MDGEEFVKAALPMEEGLTMVETEEQCSKPAAASKRRTTVSFSADGEQELESDVVKCGLLYGILDVPPVHQSAMLGLQHFVTMMSGTALLPALLFADLCVTKFSDQSAVISSTFFVMGLATLLQTTLGTRLPIIQGASAAFFVPTFTVLASDRLPKCPAGIGNFSGNATDVDSSLLNAVWMERISYVGGTLAVASLFQVFLGATGFTAVMVRHIGPLVIAPTICLIGLSLVSVVAASAKGNWYIAMLVCFLVILFSYVIDWVTVPVPTVRQRRLRFVQYPLFKSIPVLLAVGIAWGLCAILTTAGAFPDDPEAWSYQARTDVRSKAFAEAAWFRVPYPGQFGPPRVLAVGILGMMAGVVVSVVESIGDYVAAARLSGAPQPPAYAINRGVMLEGLACVLSGLFGVPVGSTSYSENIGAIGITRVGSRRVIQFSGALMIFFGVCPKVGAVFVSLPQPVMAGLFLSMFGMVTGVGLSSLQFANMNDQRNMFVVGYAIILGLALPHWLRMPADAGGGTESDAILARTGGGASRAILETFLTLMKNELFVAGFTSFVLDNVLRGSPSDRGLSQGRPARASPTSEARAQRRDLEFYDVPFGARMFGRWRWLRLLPFLPNYRLATGADT